MEAVALGRRTIRKSSTIAVITAAALTLTACSGQMMGGPPMTPAQAQLQQSNDRFTETVAQGAIVGAVGGALLGYLTGGARGAMIGAAAGTAVGAAGGYAVARNNYKQQRTEANLAALMREANSDAAAAERDAALSTQIANDLRGETAQLRARLNARTITAAQYQASLSNYRTSADTIRKRMDATGKRTQELRDTAAVELNGPIQRMDDARRREAEALRVLDAELAAVPG